MRWSTSSVYVLRFEELTAFVILVMVASAQYTPVTEQCDTETRLLNNNTALQDLAPILQCNINFDISNSCTVDYDSVSTNFSNACTDSGGQFYTTDMVLNCNVNLGGQNYNGKSYFMNTPSCIGISCTGSEIEKEFESNLYPKLEDYYAARGAQCEISKGFIRSKIPILEVILVATAIISGLSLLA